MIALGVLAAELPGDRRVADDETHQRLERCQGRLLEESDFAIARNAVERPLGPLHPCDDPAPSQRSNEDGVAYLELLRHNISLSYGDCSFFLTVVSLA
jgi:hypothetical protein